MTRKLTKAMISLRIKWTIKVIIDFNNCISLAMICVPTGGSWIYNLIQLMKKEVLVRKPNNAM